MGDDIVYPTWKRVVFIFEIKRDTDSNFLLLENIFNTICDNANINETQRLQKHNIINVSNVIVYICSKYIQTALDVFTHNVNIPADKQHLINMKSELIWLTLKSFNWREVP